LHLPVAELYISPSPAGPLVLPAPPAASTVPFGSSVIVNERRSWLIDPVKLHVPVAGLKSSAVGIGSKAVLSAPPATRTCPFVSSTAAASHRGACIEPVKVHEPAAGSNNSALIRKPLLPKPP